MPWSVFVGRPKSRGAVTLNRRNIDGNPVIDFQYLTNPYDIKVMVEGFKTSAKLCEDTSAFQRVGCRVVRLTLPACDRFKYRSDSYWECFGRHLTRFGYHAVGTCKMGSGAKHPDAVVDSKLRVIGIEGLRVVDASIMPAVTNANIEAAVYVIAEKAADMILKQHGGGHGISSIHHHGEGSLSNWFTSSHSQDFVQFGSVKFPSTTI